jgi:transposase
MADNGSIVNRFSFNNDLAGAEIFVNHILIHLKQSAFKKLMIATEATSFYDFHLVDFLATNAQLASYKPEVYRFNPRIVNSFKKGCYSDIQKTDSIDAVAIADRLRFGRLPAPYLEHQPYLPLRRLTRYRFHLVENLIREKSYFLTHLFLKFSKFSQDCPFSDAFGTTSLACISEFLTVDDIANSTVDCLVDFLQKHSKNHFAEPEKIAESLKTIASQSYRLKPQLTYSVNFVLSSTYCNIRHLQKGLKDVDNAIANEIKAFPNTLQSVSGIGPVYAAGIISEIGNVNNFPNEASLAKFAGLTWRKHQSGDFDAQETPITKTGNQYLRYYFIEASNTLKMHNDTYKKYYLAKFNEVKKHQHKRALVLTARKFVRLCYALLKKGQLYKIEN